MARVALIEDDAAIRASLIRDLAAKGHVVSSSASGLAGLTAIIADDPEVVLLDLGLPDVDGREVLAMLRGVSDVPVIVTTARDEEASVVALLDGGADDYVVKPFTAAQVDARIRALLRRSRSGDEAREAAIVVGGLVIDPMSREATLDGRRIELTRKEFDLLATLARRPGEVVTKRELLADVWQLPWGGGDRTVDVHLSWLRRKLGETAAEPRYLFSVRGVGVKLVVPSENGAD
jgi:DNA-binding response OmpR family regulator